jgi:glycosyltransferase involved in cell wall biosynthesis
MKYESGLVSIAIPTYKGKYLGEAIESALNQDYTNIEIIIVNDKSPYNIESIVNQYNDQRIRYYSNKINIGKNDPTYNWNLCLDYARGEFFVLLCDDDILLPNFVSELLYLSNKYPLCNVFHARKTNKNEKTAEITESNIWPEWESLDSFYSNKFKLERIHTVTEFLFRTEHIAKLKYIPFPLAWGSDEISILNFIKDGGIASSKDCLAVFRINDEQLSKNDTQIVKKAQARILNFFWIGKHFRNNKYDKEYMTYLSRLLIEFIRRASFVDKFRILRISPVQAIGVFHKIKIAINILRNKYTHPGYSYPGC